jgi:histone acetyltransferase (RNA polymerase elongator complex component)
VNRRPFIIPVFLPQWGCPRQCVYCAQTTITGEDRARLDLAELSTVVYRGLASRKRGKDRAVEIAFYGGNFTGLPLERQRVLLEWAFDYVEQGLVGSLRVSTRPDALSREDLQRLKRYGVRTIELGFQALDDGVLRETLRGHGVGDNLKALALVKEQGLTAGVQLMPGLPGDRPERFLSSLALLTARPPDFVRLYPVLVFKGTALARRYLEGSYRPLELEEALEVCCRAVTVLESSGIPVLRLGLQASGGVDFSGNILAGPFHPAFGDLVRGRLFREEILAAAGGLKKGRDAGLEIRVGDRGAGYLTGNGGSILASLKATLGFSAVHWKRVPEFGAGEWELAPRTPEKALEESS